MKNIYFDICAIPFYLLILWTCHARRMTQGHANRLFITINWFSLVCLFADIAMEYVVNPLPLSQERIVLGTLLSFTYKLLRNASMALFLHYIFAITRTDYLLRPLKNRLLLWLPYGILLVLLLQNFFTHNVFVITAEGGYARGPLLGIFYVIAMLYGFAGAGYCIYCKRYLTTGKWVAILSIYVMTLLGVAIQMVYPEYLVEMICTSVGVTMILLLVMRPEDTMDGPLGIQNWNTYKADLANILKTREKTQILAIQIANAQEIRTYLGENRYNQFLSEVVDEIQKIYKSAHQRVNKDLYIERPGTFYLTINDETCALAEEVPLFIERARTKFSHFADYNFRFDMKVCLIRYPEDLTSMSDIINLGHKFPQLGEIDQSFFPASEIIKSRDYDIVNHMEEILSRALAANEFEMYYQPIYDNRRKRFSSAEALLRLIDSEYGMISPGIFIPYAEANGLILPIGEIVLEQVFRFISEHDLAALGLSYIEINLSVAQGLQTDLPQTVERLQKQYHIEPKQVNFEITETLHDSISDVLDRNVRTLRDMGYGFSLDDYGVGYSNIQRMSRLPLDIIKIDKSLVDDMFSEDGRVIIHNTVRMMQGIRKELVIEGVETREEVEALSEMSCDFIQGFYYSKPLPVEAFVQFLKDHNLAA